MIDKEKIEAALKALGKCEWHPTSCDGAVSAGYDCDDASDFLTAHHGTIRQALEAQMAGGWQDISTAPKDGNFFLVTDGKLNDMARFCKAKIMARNTFGARVWTHWQPLPKPPQEA